jgi:RHH-type rel operon transcriptional repressor/antitoxin RelB
MSIAIRLSDDLESLLESVAKKMKRSKSFIAREAIETYLEDMQDYYKGMEVLKNPGRIYSYEEVRKELGLDD